MERSRVGRIVLCWRLFWWGWPGSPIQQRVDFTRHAFHDLRLGKLFCKIPLRRTQDVTEEVPQNHLE